MYANLNEVVVYDANWNEAVWSSLKLKKLFEVPQKWIKLFEVTQNLIKMFHLARIWMQLLLFGQSWFSLLEFTQIFPIYENILNFTQIWMKLSQFAQISLRLSKYTQMILILSKFEQNSYNSPGHFWTYWNFKGDFLYSPILNKTVLSYPQLNKAVANWQNLIWLMDFTQVFPINLNVFFSPKFDWSFSHLPRFNRGCWTLPKCSYFTQMSLILPKTLLKFYSWPKFNEGCWNDHIIPVDSRAVFILPSGAKKNGKIVRDYCIRFETILPLNWLLFCHSLENRHYHIACECSCILCPNFESFQRWGCDYIPMPYAYDLHQ